MKFQCPECSSENQVTKPDQFAKCSICHSSLMVDFDGIKPVYTYSAVLKSDQVGFYLNGYFEKKGFKEPKKILNAEPCYIPFWQEKKGEKMKRANSEFPDTEIDPLPFTKEYFDFAKTSDNYITIFGIETQPENTLEMNLIYVPFFNVTIEYNEETYIYLIDAISGSVYGNQLLFTPVRNTYKFFPLFLIIFIVFFAINYFFDQLMLSIAMNIVSFYLFYSLSLNLIEKQKWK